MEELSNTNKNDYDINLEYKKVSSSDLKEEFIMSNNRKVKIKEVSLY